MMFYLGTVENRKTLLKAEYFLKMHWKINVGI